MGITDFSTPLCFARNDSGSGVVAATFDHLCHPETSAHTGREDPFPSIRQDTIARQGNHKQTAKLGFYPSGCLAKQHTSIPQIRRIPSAYRSLVYIFSCSIAQRRTALKYSIYDGLGKAVFGTIVLNCMILPLL